MYKNLLAVLAASLALGTLWSPAARAEPYEPRCGWNAPTENPDCFFIETVDHDVFPIAPGEVSSVIAKGKQACAQMAADSGPDPIANWAAQFGDSPATRKQAAAFANLAAVAYCRSVLGY